MQFDGAVCDRETDAESTSFCTPGPIDAVERAKDLLDLVFGDARAPVVDLKLDDVCTACLGRPQADLNSRAWFGVPNGIASRGLDLSKKDRQFSRETIGRLV